MNNLHITLTNCAHESFFIKEVHTISESIIAERVYIAAGLSFQSHYGRIRLAGVSRA
mgnify:CR=1 FL=1